MHFITPDIWCCGARRFSGISCISSIRTVIGIMPPPPPPGGAEVLEAPKAPKKIFGLKQLLPKAPEKNF